MFSKSLLTALLHPDPRKRLGAIGGALDIKGILSIPNILLIMLDHPFFKGIHWDKVEKQKPPIIPKLKDKFDTRYFRDLKDDWEWDTTEVDPDELGMLTLLS